MGLLEEVMEEGMKEENDPHPQEGVLMDDVFLRLEEETREEEHEIPKRDKQGEIIIDAKTGEPETEKVKIPVGTDLFRLMRYDDTSTQDAIDGVLVDGKEILKDAWDAASYFFERQIKAFNGTITQAELDDEIKNRSVTGQEPEIDGHSTAKTPCYEVVCDDCNHANELPCLDDDQECESCGEVLEIPQDLKDSVVDAIQDVADDEEPADTGPVTEADENNYPGMLKECMKTINNSEGLPSDRLVEYLEYELQEKFGIPEPDESKIWEFVQEVKKDDDTY